MKLTPKIQQAINLAAEKHLGQKRKSSASPYIIHPFSVAFIVSGFTKDENVITAALLHDVLEDCKNYSYQDMKKEFGVRVAKIVKEVSEERNPDGIKNKKESWELRKKCGLKKLAKASQEAMIVSAADKIHNINSIVKSYHKHGEDLWKIFNAPPERKFWYYGEAVNILRKRLKNKIVKELEKAYKNALEVFEKHQKVKGEINKINIFTFIKKFFFR